MTQRVRCRRCTAHFDIGTRSACLTCGGESFDPVTPTAGDLETATTAVVRAAEQIDLAIVGGQPMTAQHAADLRAACRVLAFVRAGVLCL
jgi:hypothetical protein